ncbi:MAG TPA: prolyl oligopeptidase family serine peptidase [Vicinamibacterales bacterium]|nr:prolyl oligopeptidase family serine peptidase [Vicinamibacterales bacterium]
MKTMKRTLIVLLAVLTVSAGRPLAGGAPAVKGLHVPTMAQFMSAGYPLELVAAKRADRIAWIANDKGLRNVFTASAPGFRAVRVTSFMKDDGVDTTQLSMSDDGTIVSFTRGHTANREGWVASPEADPAGVERAIWAASTTGGAAWRLAAGQGGAISPDGRYVAYAKDGQIYRVPTAQAAPRTSEIDKGLKPYIRIWGINANPVWSPDSRKIAFVSARTDHSYIAVFDTATRKVTYMSPNVDRDTSPTWSADSTRIAFIRRPGTPFAQQSQSGVGGLGNPPGPAFNAAAQGRGGGRGGGGGGQGRGGRGGEAPEGQPQPQRPGLTNAFFPGGYDTAFWVADVKSGDAREFWHNAKDDRVFTGINAITWRGNHVVFQLEPEEWTRFYAIAVPERGGEAENTGPVAKPKLFGAADGSEAAVAAPISLTPQDGQIETYSFSGDGRFLYYGTNATDSERRHLWRVPVAGGTPEQVTRGDGIEHTPLLLPSGRYLAALTAAYNRPQSVAIFPAPAPSASALDSSAQKAIYPTLTREFPTDAHVMPQDVVINAPDGLQFHNQLFLPKDLRPGEKRPAIVFVHGGPVRQMLLGYHYMEVYHLFYGVNQWLASQGYVVLSVNYRGGIGYGRSFRTAPNTNARGNSEYQDVLAAGRYLQSRADVDPKRVGIWGLSYGGLLTAQALARNSDIFVAGVDMAGVHLYGNNLDPENLAYRSSAISEIANWKSPVFLIHGDDDRNVNFAQTVGLVNLLRAHNVPHEIMVQPDDTHETLLYKRWLPLWARMEAFLNKHLKKEPATSTQAVQR